MLEEARVLKLLISHGLSCLVNDNILNGDDGTSILNLASQPAEGPVMLHSVLVVPLTHVVHTCISDAKAVFADVLYKVNPQGHLLMVIARSEGEGHLKVPGVHHVLVPLGEVVGDAFEQGVDLGGYGELGDYDSDWVGVLRELSGAGQLHHLLKRVQRMERFCIIQAPNERLNLIEVGLFAQELVLLEVVW